MSHPRKHIAARYRLEDAKHIAAQNAADDADGWEYRVVDFKNGWAKIEIFDENGELVGEL